MARNKYDIDEVLEDKFDLNQLKRLAGYLRPYKIQMGIVLFLMLSASAYRFYRFRKIHNYEPALSVL